MTFKAAALKILSNTKKPLSPAEIVQIAVEENILVTEGETPEATMAATLYSDIKSNAKSKFQKIGKGKFALKSQKESASDPLLIVKRQNQIVRKELNDRLHKMDDSQFEYLVADLLSKMGYEDVEVTGKSGDEGIDVTGVLTVGGLTSVPTVVQVKQYRTSKIGPNYIRELRGSAKVGQRGLIVTLNKFTAGAIAEARASEKMPVSLVDGDKLLDLLIDNRVGINTESVFIQSIDDEYFTADDFGSEVIEDVNKYRVMWPLPGGVDSYVTTLVKLLQEIKSGNSSQTDLVNWFIKNFEDVTSEETSKGYLRVPRYIGVINIDKGKVSLTEEGFSFLKSQDKDYLFEVISNNILAFDDVYAFIKSSEGVSESEILEFLRDNFNINWSTNAQVNFRVRWMMNLEKVIKTNRGLVAK